VLLACCGGPLPDSEGEAGLSICAAGATLEGVDVSRWDATVDWAAVKAAGISFAIARVSDGLGFPDSYFDSNWAAIKSQGMVRGSYQYFEPAQDPVAQANLLLQHIGTPGPGDLAPAIDVETMGGMSVSAVNAGIALWISRVHAVTGRRPIVYASPSFWSGLGEPAVAADLWVAHWGVICPSVPSAFSGWKLWQYTATGSVAGISGQADRSRFNGSLPDLLAYAGGADAGYGGIPDGGAVDAGAPDAGAGDPVVASAAGCSTGAPGLAWLALALLARRGRLNAGARR
jgi:GH25 family lysozyme M1 (1,4-beta-N-acetylmuramidase)